MAWNQIASAEVKCTNGGGSTSSADKTPVRDTTGADLIYLATGIFFVPGQPSAPADSYGNPWVEQTRFQSSNLQISIWVAEAPTVGAGHQFWQACGSGFLALAMEAWSGSKGVGATDQVNGANTAGATSLTSGAVTPAAGSLVISAMVLAVQGQLANLTIDSSFGTVIGIDHVTGFSEGSAHSSKTSSSAEAPKWDWAASGSQEAAVTTVTFKPASGGGGVTISPSAGSVGVAGAAPSVAIVSGPRQVLWCASGAVSSDSSVRYYPIGDSRLTTAFGAEANAQVTYRTPGIHSHLTIVITGNSGSGGSTVVRFRKNGVTGNQTITIPAGQIGTFTDGVHSDSSVAGDLLDVQVDASASGGQSISYTIISGVFSSSAGSTVKKYLASGTPNTLNAGSSKFALIGGANMSDTGVAEARVQAKLTQTEVLANACIVVSANTLNASTVVTLRKNGGNGTVTITIPSGATGTFEDLTHSDTFSSGDLVNWKWDATASGSGSLQFTLLAIESTCASGAARTYAGHGTTAGVTAAAAPGGDDVSAIGIGAGQEATFGVSFTASRLQVVVSTNANADDVIFVWWQNGVQGNQIVTVPAGATGIFEDTANSDVVGPTDTVAIVFADSGGNTNFTSINWLAMGPLAPAPADTGAHIIFRNENYV